MLAISRNTLFALLLCADFLWALDNSSQQHRSYLPWLRVDNNYIVDSTGKPIRLIGHGISPINPGEWGNKTIQQIVTEYKAKGFNSMRVSFYRNNNYNQTRDQIKELGPESFIDKWI
ncbi:MAG TPA: hypothetical protein VLX68_00990 [Chitinivibrionales bacterium]|nr:hypothetical protein [Chitinivibrionales bacterium]